MLNNALHDSVQEVVAGKRPDPNSIAADRALIASTASCIRNLWKEINAAEKFIAAGGEFKTLHENLSKNSRHDRSRIGWYRAFNEEPEGKFGCDRRTAERCIKIFEAFGHVGAIAPTWKLPQHFRTLAALAALKIPVLRLSKCLNEETIGPHSTASDVRKLGESLGLIEPKKPTIKKPTEPASTVIPTLAWAWTRESQEKRGEFLDAVGADDLRKTMSAEMLKQFRDRFESQRQLAEKNASAKTRLKLVASKT